MGRRAQAMSLALADFDGGRTLRAHIPPIPTLQSSSKKLRGSPEPTIDLANARAGVALGVRLLCRL